MARPVEILSRYGDLNKQVLVLEVGEYQGGFRDLGDGLIVGVERGQRPRAGPVDLQRAHPLVLA